MTRKNPNDNFCTPREFLDPLREFNGGPPAFDPCSNPHSIVGAEIELYGPSAGGEDGLIHEFPRDGLTFGNPPYSAKSIWMRKYAEQAGYGSEVVALVPADTDTGWFHCYAATADHRVFWAGRLVFDLNGAPAPNGARFPSLGVYWGDRVERFCRIMGKHGFCC
jgi:hypothetical protein